MIHTETTGKANSFNGASKLSLTPELQNYYAENGYLILRNVVSKEKLDHVKAQILGKFESEKQSGSLFAGGGTISGHINCYPGEEARVIYNELEAAGIVELVKIGRA